MRKQNNVNNAGGVYSLSQLTPNNTQSRFKEVPDLSNDPIVHN